MRVDLFDFDLPQERIALRPASPRDSARRLVLDGAGALSAETTRLVDHVRERLRANR